MGVFILPVTPVIEGLSRRYAKRKVSRETGISRLVAACGVVHSRHRPQQAEPPRSVRGTQISYVSLLLAVLTGILHAAVAPVVSIGGIHPNLVLVAVVLVTALNGFGPGVAWAFAGGLTANLLIREPLGSLPFALLLIAAAVAAGERLFGRLSWAYPLACAALASIVADTMSLAILQMVDPPMTGGYPAQTIIASALLNTVLAAIFLVPAKVLLARSGAGERAAW